MLYSTFNAADAVGVSRQTIQNYVKNGLLDAAVYRYRGGRSGTRPPPTWSGPSV